MMHGLFFLLFLFPNNIDGLLCVANGTYENTIGQFTDELHSLSNRIVKNMIIKTCQVTIELNHYARKMIIAYHGDKSIDKPADSISLYTHVLFGKSSAHPDNTLSYVCSSVDYCDRIYIQNWSQWLFKINFIQFAKTIHQFFKINDNKDYASSTCYNINQVEQCSTHVCYSLTNKNQTINKCAERNKTAIGSIKPEGVTPQLLEQYQMVILEIETTVIIQSLSKSDTIIHSNEDEYQLNHNISYYCTFNLCNSELISGDLVNEIEMNYNITSILHFSISITSNETSFISNKADFPSNELNSISIIVFVFVYIVRWLIIKY